MRSIESTRNRYHQHRDRPRPFQYPRTFLHRTAGGQDIINQQDTLAGDAHGIGDGKCPPDIGPALVGSQGDLRLGPANPPHPPPQQGQMPLLCQKLPQQHRLVIAALSQTPGMQRHRHDQIGLSFIDETGQLFDDQESQRPAQVGLAAVLEGVDQVAAMPAVDDRGASRIEGRRILQACPAGMVRAGPLERETADRAVRVGYRGNRFAA